MPAPINPLQFSLTTRFKDRWITQFVRQKNPVRTLDIGCGIGYQLSLIDDLPGVRIGLDLSRDSLIGAAMYTQAQRVQAAGDQLPFGTANFDCILLSDVIEHLADDRNALREIYRIAKNDALVIISTPALEGLLTHTPIKHWLHGQNDTHQTDQRDGYTKETLQQLCRDCGIQLQGATYTNYYLTEIMLAILKFGFYLKKRRYHSQHDLLEVQQSILFQCYQTILFPLFYSIGRVEEFLCRPFIKGHCLIVWGTVVKH
jgi:ubiquinone/menaquinone biosynthesis C-methylase UbiE